MSEILDKITTENAGLLAKSWLKKLISIKSLSRNEQNTAEFIAGILSNYKYQVYRKNNNVWAFNKNYNPDKPTLLLNSHLDTVKPTTGWLTDPFTPVEKEGKIIGLGSNDAGAPLISLLSTFLLSEELDFNFNRVFVASAEEEISGDMGLHEVIPELGKIDLGIIGEPTQMEMAVAEKGLLVIDALVKGKAGHAAREGGINAIYKALEQIEQIQNLKLEKVSPVLGPVKFSVTQIRAGTQHKVIPDKCEFVMDVRTNEYYSNQQVFEILQQQLDAELTARSFKMNSSGIDEQHELVQAAKKLNINCFGSPTTSDQAVISGFPTVKMGPGDSNRSHTANEFVFEQELTKGIEIFVQLLEKLNESNWK